MTIKQKKELKSFIKGVRSLILMLCFLVMQYFIPIFASTPTCSGSQIMCASGIPQCTSGHINGFAECRYVDVLGFKSGCTDMFGFFPNEAICSSGPVSSSSSSSGAVSSSSSSSSSGSSNAPFCSGTQIMCNVGTPICTGNHIGGFANCRFVDVLGIVPGCTDMFGFFPREATCLSSSSSSSSSSGAVSSSSSSSGFVANSPYCSSGIIMCNSGVPSCPTMSRTPVPDCGSRLGLSGVFGGPGCRDAAATLFDVGAATCVPPARVVLNTDTVCDKKNLCPKTSKRVEPCREDKHLCKCICPFTLKNQKHTPRCNKELALCSKGYVPICTKSNNHPVCQNGKLICKDIYSEIVDLLDKVFCIEKR